ncbi:MAG: helix-turn-helix domain-containing protein [Planctomycetota bacterium]|nr:helix-turn-helix domain-containing protein [Planctomycetota bacterium]
MAIQALTSRGWSHRRIARELGVHRETVARYVRRAEEEAPQQSKPAKAPPGSDPPNGPSRQRQAGSGEGSCRSKPASWPKRRWFDQGEPRRRPNLQLGSVLEQDGKQNPYDVVPHVRIFAAGTGQLGSLPQPPPVQVGPLPRSANAECAVVTGVGEARQATTGRTQDSGLVNRGFRARAESRHTRSTQVNVDIGAPRALEPYVESRQRERSQGP